MFNKANRYDSLFQYYGEKNNVDWLLLKAQVKAESNFNPDAKSPVGALGLPQFMRATWEEWQDSTPGIQLIKKTFSRNNPEHAIRSQAVYMKWLHNRFNYMGAYQRLDAVLASYNWGIGNVKRSIKKHGFLELSFTPIETQNYIKKIRGFLNNYKNEGKKEMEDKNKIETPEKLEKTNNDAKKPTMEFGIKETKDLVITIIKLGNATKLSLKDDKITFTDIPHFASAVASLPAALGGIKYVPAELGDLTDTEVAELVNLVIDELEWANDEKVRELVQHSLNAALEIKEIIELL